MAGLCEGGNEPPGSLKASKRPGLPLSDRYSVSFPLTRCLSPGLGTAHASPGQPRDIPMAAHLERSGVGRLKKVRSNNSQEPSVTIVSMRTTEKVFQHNPNQSRTGNMYCSRAFQQTFDTGSERWASRIDATGPEHGSEKQ
ncbi:hypothetical protein ANN_14205 [Periplaneta americana]|uniref:Uncharacterized protein n=1 Tax=Periplaneta americana TaxID=6978 RepID=A0ABQ8SVN5_PERAM|nr:hypothetical protein ANN_14205 [Periplaneta americana]